jgi:aminoglycoside phosphotransferase (APT) family kinase protein
MGRMVNQMPAAEVQVDAELVRRLIVAQHGDLAGQPVRSLANGWDNVLFRVGERLIARMPRRELGAQIIGNEQRWLAELAPALPLPVPYAVRTGAPGDGYPWPWSLVPYLQGAPAFAALDLDMEAAAVALGGFLRALHVPAPEDAPENQFRGIWIGETTERFLANLRAACPAADIAAAERVWAAAVAADRHSGPPVWLHGDLHPANILVHDGQVSAVIDWGDITSGDPACDLAVSWLLLPTAHHETFWAAYGAADFAALRARAHGWALYFALVFLAFSADNPDMHGIGARTLPRVLAR